MIQAVLQQEAAAVAAEAADLWARELRLPKQPAAWATQAALQVAAAGGHQ